MTHISGGTTVDERTSTANVSVSVAGSVSLSFDKKRETWTRKFAESDLELCTRAREARTSAESSRVARPSRLISTLFATVAQFQLFADRLFHYRPAQNFPGSSSFAKAEETKDP